MPPDPSTDVPLVRGTAPAWLRGHRRRAASRLRRIVCVGDSVTLNPPPPALAYPQALKGKLGQFAHVINAGVNGSRTDNYGLAPGTPQQYELPAAFAQNVLSHRPYEVFVMLGLNDITSSVVVHSPATVEANLQLLYTKIIANGGIPRPVTILPFGASSFWSAPIEASRLSINAWVRAQPFAFTDGEVLGDFTVPAQPVLKPGYSDDGRHLIAVGADALAEAIFTQIYGRKQVARL